MNMRAHLPDSAGAISAAWGMQQPQKVWQVDAVLLTTAVIEVRC